jgi:hypothetical protein
MRPPHRAFAASAIAVVCCACLITTLKSLFHSECIGGQDVEPVVEPGSTALRPTITSLVVAAATAFGMTAACIVKPLSKRAVNMVSAVCSKWQPVYFIIVSLEKILLRAIVIPHADGWISKHGAACHLSADQKNQCLAATFLWDCTILMSGVSTIYVDIDPLFTPAFRRCAQCLLALCLCVDAVGSYIWGNDLAGVASLSVSNFKFQLDNQITSCITSQAVLALHFAFVGWRSCHGRGWYYASLRFELDQCGRASLSRLSLPNISQDLQKSFLTSSSSSSSSHQAKTPMSDLEATPVDLQSDTHGKLCFASLSRVRQHFLQFQQRHMSQCREFVIPCVAVNDREGFNADFALARPLFNLSFLRPLQRIADRHPKFYYIFLFFFLTLPTLISSALLKPQIKGTVCFFLNSAIFIHGLGFLSSKHYNVDRVAVKHIVSSFRFAIFFVLLSQWIALEARLAFLVLYKGYASIYRSLWDVFSFTVLALSFSTAMLVDCSPHLPAAIQIVVTVRTCNTAQRYIVLFKFPSGWMGVGFWIMGVS